MTLKETATLVSPSGVAGLNFTDEAATANALVPGLKAAGANAIVLLIHQGASIQGRYDDPFLPRACRRHFADPGQARSGDSAGRVGPHPQRLHLPRSEAGGEPRLLTSAGKYGAMVTDIRLTFDRRGRQADWREGRIRDRTGRSDQHAATDGPLVPTHRVFPADPEVAALVERYRDAASDEANRPVGRLAGAVFKGEDFSKESTAAELIADGQLFVARGPGRGNADFALMNNGGARTDLLPDTDGTVRFGQIFAMQPFANNVVTKSYTGAEIKAVLEQQFASGLNTIQRPNLLMPSANFRFGFDKSRPEGQRIVAMTLNGKPIDPALTYRVAVNNFLASGGDNFTLLAQGRDPSRRRARSRRDRSLSRHQPAGAGDGADRRFDANELGLLLHAPNAAAARRSCAACGCEGRRLPA